MVAVMKLASVPASIARRPSRARSWRRVGASAPMPPIWMPIELKLAKPHSAKVAMVNDCGSSDALQRPELRVGDELVEHHARAEQVADRRRRRATARPGSRRSARTPSRRSCCRLQADDARGCALTSAISARNEISIAPTLSARCRPSPVPRPGGVDHVDVGLLDLQLHGAHRLRDARSRARTSSPSSACRARS